MDSLCEQEIEEDVFTLFKDLPPLLDRFTDLIWVEKPLDRDKYPGNFYFSEELQKEAGMVWSRQGYAGCPDLIGYLDGVLTLGDLKTSKRLYWQSYASLPKELYALTGKKFKDHPNHEMAKQVVAENREMLNGYLAYQNTTFQLAGYAQAIEESLGLKVERQVVIVTSLSGVQLLEVSQDDKEYGKSEWERRVRAFKEDSLIAVAK
ncbi:hypothetical protein K9N68_37645 (plasmid) [Kovacikia minuta CCNUW1]|uniref:hypothetical protein n=1 Tax=Kovacikia minuta TaxID=2931930 RepID=UPI001CC98C56|nr:hypothetical protein [Kovacikia minuta]UBF29938.1 hypothetical protein K9N68_37645 [Kovacikia minuta CCNUW1]